MRSLSEKNMHLKSPWWTVPNIICYGRIVGSVVLVFTSWLGFRTSSLAIVLLLIFSDWLDGKIARLLKQRTELGAKVDSIADAIFSAAVLISVTQINPSYLAANVAWLCAALLSYAVNMGVCLAKFKNWPSYHTRLSKMSWLVVAAAIIGAFAGWDVWLVRIAASFVIAANVEETMITLALKHYQVDISSLPVAIQLREKTNVRPSA